jgi:beta-phosphoglucomutase family hydrolase
VSTTTSVKGLYGQGCEGAHPVTDAGAPPAFPVAVVGCLFDMDGVLTSTAQLHAQAWKATFDAFLAARDPASGERDDPFDIAADYREHVDGRLREDGVRAFLASRHITLPDGSPDDPPGNESVHALAEAKNERLLRLVEERGVQVYPGSVDLVRAARAAGMRTAVVSASANTRSVLESAGVTELFDAVVDGVAAADRHLAGKPSPETYLAAAADLGLSPGECAVFEDAVAGVEAGKAGGFALVVGVDRDGNRDELLASGASIVVDDLSELLPA